MISKEGVLKGQRRGWGWYKVRGGVHYARVRVGLTSPLGAGWTGQRMHSNTLCTLESVLCKLEF